MGIIHQKDKRSGITYAYESVSYWDKELKQPRSRRRLLGRRDPATGEIVPTGSCRAQLSHQLNQAVLPILQHYTGTASKSLSERMT